MATARRISRDHPLRRLFEQLVRRRFIHDSLLCDAGVAEYVAGVLTDFTHVDNLYRIRNARGRRARTAPVPKSYESAAPERLSIVNYSDSSGVESQGCGAARRSLHLAIHLFQPDLRRSTP